MSNSCKLSIVVSVYNGESYLEKCLKSASFADEIVVVDNSSTDRTEEIAKKFTINVYKQKNDPAKIDLQKNFGFEKATGDWILCLDADEVITPELRDEIKNKIANCPLRSEASKLGIENSVNGYWIQRKNIIFGKWMEHSGWCPDPQLRLFRRGKGKFMDEHFHEALKVEGEVGSLNGHLLHYNYDTISQFLQKLANYGPNEAEQLIKKGYIFDWRDAVRFPAKEFLSRFFAREGYKDGLHGLMLSSLMAFYHLVVFACIWEKQKFKQVDGADVLAETEKEMTKASRDIFFWFSQEKIKLIKNPIIKTVHRILRKVK